MFVPLFSFFNLIKGMAQSDYDKMLSSLYKNTVPVITTDELMSLISNEDVLILDTRSQEEFDVSHLKDAKFIDYKNFDIDQLDLALKKKKIVVYCSVGYRSERIGEKLLEAGYPEVFNLYGGIFNWVNEGNQVFANSDVPTDSVHAYNRLWGKWLKKGIKVYE